MDGAQLTVTVGPAVAEIYGNLPKPGSADATQVDLPQLVVAASSAPVASTPTTGLTVKAIEQYLVTLPGVSTQLRDAINAVSDPSTTLLIPVPVQYTTSSKVTVQNVDGVALGDDTGVGAGVIWVKNGIVYVVAGTIKRSDAIDIANNLT